MIRHEGKDYARVSEILQPFTNFSGIDPKVLAAKCEIGTDVHEAISDFLNNKSVFLGPEKAWKYYKSFKAWYKHMQPDFVVNEARYFCDEKKITGAVDGVIKLPGIEELLLIDFKTSVSESPTWVMQAHLYYYLITKKHQNIAPRFLFIKLDYEGLLPKVFEYKFDKNIHNKCMIAIDNFWKMKQS